MKATKELDGHCEKCHSNICIVPGDYYSYPMFCNKCKGVKAEPKPVTKKKSTKKSVKDSE